MYELKLTGLNMKPSDLIKMLESFDDSFEVVELNIVKKSHPHSIEAPHRMQDPIEPVKQSSPANELPPRTWTSSSPGVSYNYTSIGKMLYRVGPRW